MTTFERPNDRWLRWIGIPLIVLLANLLYLKDDQHNPVLYTGWVFIGMAYVTLAWEGSVSWVYYVRKLFPDARHSLRRILITFTGYFLLAVVCQSLFVFLTDLSGLAIIPITSHVYQAYIGIGIFCSLLLGITYEIIYYLHQYRQAVAEAEAIQKSRIQGQFDSLKSQVNPHFLFNSLNSLSALISEDKQQANRFLEEMSSVYRYLLQSNDRKLVTLQTEIRFIESFFYLLKARYGPAIELHTHIAPELLDHYLPPFSLQMLIENAIRHNIILADRPLVISLQADAKKHTEPTRLQVSNNIQRKNIQVKKQPGGLTQLTERFKLLRLPRPIIQDDGLAFSVHVPLITKDADFLIHLP
ncbi:sensor histidine kinase [Larkinella insperata]|uniref:Sensor histidine kinase n=1 Tax=Larkinella insperata TaxID=332158 RepID=A0ABW3QIZ4_9BACT|nr:histidine kinase [Larkinella insperata]